MTKKTSSALLSGITSFGAILFGGYALFRFLIPIHDYAILKWIPVALCAIGFWQSGKDNRETPLKHLPFLFLQLLLLHFIQFFQFPFVFVLMLVGALALVISREEVKLMYKGVALSAIVGIFAFYLFAQPLIIKKDGFGYNEYGELVNAVVLWGDDANPVKTLPTNQRYLTNNQQPIDLEQYEGKSLFLTFWATWCGPCMREKPRLERLKASFKDNPHVVFVDISIDDDQERWMNYLAQKSPQGVQLISDDINATKIGFEFRSIPTHIIVNADGAYKICNRFDLARKVLADPSKVNRYVGMKNTKPSLSYQTSNDD